MKNLLRFTPITMAVIIVIIWIFAYSIGISFFDIMELKTVDLRFKFRGSIPSGSNVVLAVIDEKSLAKEGKWIWPRSKFAEMVTKISNAGAKVIAFDVGFLESDEKSIIKTIENIEGNISSFCPENQKVKDYLKELKVKTDYDALLAKAIKESKAKVILGYFFLTDKDKNEFINEDLIRRHQENILSSRYMFVRYTSEKAQNTRLFEASFPQSNIKVISEQANFSGYFNMFPDQDGVVRRVPTVLSFKDMLYAPLSIMAVCAFYESAPSVKVDNYGIESLKIEKITIPTDEMGNILVNYRGEQKTFPYISITDILNDKVPVSALKDKIVMVGATAIGIYDMRATPFETVFPGVEIHANIIDSILSKDFLYQPGWSSLFNIFFISVAGILLGFVLQRTGVVTSTLITFVMFFGYAILCYLVFVKNGWILNLVYPLTVILVIYTCVTVYKYLIESKDKRFIKKAFSTYLAPSVVNQLIASPDKLKLGGERRKITAFFSDIQGFTTISEKLKPEDLVELLNEFLTEMTEIIISYEGTVDKYIGDAIVAFFGAPNDLENQAEVAIKVSIDLQKKLVQLRKKWKSEGKAEIKMRIGLCTGDAVIGNMGSKNRMNYTMMGDIVNTASRLEGVNKVYGTYILISESTYKDIADNTHIVARELDSIIVVGKNKPVSIYQILGYAEECDEKTLDILDYYSNGLRAYRQQSWDRAIKLFSSALEIDPEDSPSAVMIKRCNEFKVNPPGKNWNGAHTLKSK